jgi:2-polyprenyl-3-methyl-5-hydroxy-6-metoxy-1,4-benzoquinol methylase
MRYRNTLCAICESFDNSIEIFPENTDSTSATREIFSARRLPDRRHYRWVRCRACNLFRSDPVLDINLNELYMKSTFDYGNEIPGLKKTYGRLVRMALKPQRPQGHMLEVGGGNGFFLEEALNMGFDSVEGVEPSIAAVGMASPEIRKYMKVSMFDDKCVADQSSDVIAIFHTLDHLEQPIEMLKTVHQKLRVGGKVVIAVHNIEAISARVLKSRSPIFDIEHTYLFSTNTLKMVLESAGFEDVIVKPYFNLYSLSYITHLLPIPRHLKKKILESKLNNLLLKVKIWIPLGNLFATGLKRK